VIEIRREAGLSAAELLAADFSFDVSEEAVPPFDGAATLQTVPVASYRKAYGLDPAAFADVGGDRLLAVARDEGWLQGYLLASKAWNGFVEINAFGVGRESRRSGLGRRLMGEALAWTGEMGLAGLRAETQSNNVAACRFYEGFGFRLGGFDRHLYDALGLAHHETALYWYLFLDHPAFDRNRLSAEKLIVLIG
jgi:ribosomal protein S18 acetylase RimI-like enzyme